MLYNFQSSASVKKILSHAKDLSKKLGLNYIASEHILYGICAVTDTAASKILASFGVTKNSILQVFVASGASGQGAYEDDIELTPTSKEIFTKATVLAVHYGQDYYGAEHILLGLLFNEQSVAVSKILKGTFRIDTHLIIEKVIAVLTSDENKEEVQKVSNKDNKQSDSRLPEELLEMGVDLTQKAREGKIDKIIGREKETERIIEVLCRKTKNNPVLIGEAGVGKSAVVEGLALRIVKNDVPEFLAKKSIFSLEIGSLMAGTKFRGALEEKLKKVIDIIMKDQNIIVFIDEIHTLVSAGHKEGEVNPADMLKPYLSRGELQTVGATTTEEYYKFIEKDKALERRFAPIMVEPPSVEQTIEILRGIKDHYEAFHKIKISDEAIIAAATLSDRYIMDRNLPDKAIDLIDEASSRAKVLLSGNQAKIRLLMEQQKKHEIELKEATFAKNTLTITTLEKELDKIKKEIANIQQKENEGEGQQKTIYEQEIAAVVSQMTGVPLTKISQSEKEKLLKLESILGESVISQKEAVSGVAKAVRRARAGLKDPNKPIGSFLFLGPTGVGKTQLCKALAGALFDNEDAIVRLDMSEYMESHSVSKLIGSPPGYVGFDDGGQLTEIVRRKPYCVVLFDEIEKAHSDVYNMLLQLLDDGRLTDSKGRTVSFKNAIIIMTSNIGAREASEKKSSLGFVPTEDKQNRTDIFMQAAKERFKPEFLNRIDLIAVFDSLTQEDIGKICGMFINKLIAKLKEQNIDLHLTDKALAYIIKKGYNEEYGARPLKRIIVNEIENSLADKILLGSASNRITVDEKNGALVLE